MITIISYILIYLCVYFIIWELYVLGSEHMIEYYIQKQKKHMYNKFELISQYSYTIWTIFGITIIDWKLFCLLFALNFVVQILLYLNIHYYIKIWILRFDSILSIIIIVLIFKYNIHCII